MCTASSTVTRRRPTWPQFPAAVRSASVPTPRFHWPTAVEADPGDPWEVLAFDVPTAPHLRAGDH